MKFGNFNLGGGDAEDKDLLSRLQKSGKISDEQAEQARRRQKRSNSSIEDALVALEAVEQEVIFSELAAINDLEFVHLAEKNISDDFISDIPRKVILKYNFVPVAKERKMYTLAFASPPLARDKQQLRTILNAQRLDIVIATPDDIQQTITSLFGLGMETVMEIEKVRGPRSEVTNLDSAVQNLEQTAEDASVSQLFNLFLKKALELNTTDIHIEPFEDKINLRFRVDGMLRRIPAPQGLRQLHSALISFVKVQANLNIAEQRLPHDGRLRVSLKGEVFDLRISIMPTRFGETLNMRILNRNSIFYDLEDLGLDPQNLKILKRLLDLPHGMILVTGPTGSGKSTTLYASLDKTDKVQRKVITVEDPIEYQMEGISQIQINAPIGLTFAKGLRSILRHDPDIVLVGEIRDTETAEIAIRAALTGHLVLSTLHTNDSIGAVNRLVDMGIDPFLVATSLSASIAQRLVRRVCKSCSQEIPAEAIPNRIRKEMAHELSMDPSEVRAFKGKGCGDCSYSGYAGRVAIYEFFLMDETLEDMITSGKTSVELRNYARTAGMKTLRDSGWHKVQEGRTSIEEILRITTSFDISYDME
ncbi:MAG: GspE/PulE family protein [Lentisphaeria bacterium]|nr:GspE/PulE family protein [Lentisphaeria bacterium]